MIMISRGVQPTRPQLRVSAHDAGPDPLPGAPPPGLRINN